MSTRSFRSRTTGKSDTGKAADGKEAFVGTKAAPPPPPEPQNEYESCGNRLGFGGGCVFGDCGGGLLFIT